MCPGKGGNIHIRKLPSLAKLKARAWNNALVILGIQQSDIDALKQNPDTAEEGRILEGMVQNLANQSAELVHTLNQGV